VVLGQQDHRTVCLRNEDGCTDVLILLLLRHLLLKITTCQHPAYVLSKVPVSYRPDSLLGSTPYT
jgi:hypothetical protein